MKVILIQDVDKLGKKYEVKDVAAGFARNSLFPKNLAKLATPNALKWLEAQEEIQSKRSEEGLQEVQKVVAGIDGAEVVISVKVGEKGQLFESVASQKISEKLKEIGFEVKKSQIDLNEPIKEIGEYPVKIKFDHNLESTVQVIITEKE